MSDTDQPPPDDVLAGEYVLGVLDAAERRAVEARIAAEPPFAEEVAAWEAKLGSLAAAIEPQEVPAHVWPRIRARLGWQAAESKRPGLWSSVGFWRAATVLAAAAAIVVWVVRAPTGLSGAAVFTLAAQNGAPGWVASVDSTHGTMLVVPVPSPPSTQGRVPELWLLPPGRSPQALALLSTARSSSFMIPTALRAELVNGAVLAVSLEPPGGAPGGAPTGPVVAQGRVRL